MELYKKMKKVLFILFTASGLSAKSQDSGSEIKPMIKQIALLKTYIAYLEKGYDIARKGLNTISDIKNGHWKMDIEFFNSLKNVNPKIKDYVKVAAIVKYQVGIATICRQLKKQDFNNDEIAYVNRVILHLIGECEIRGDQLAMIIADQKLQMSDDERIKNIDRIYEEVQDQYSFIRNFSNEASTLILQRVKEKNDVEVSQKLRGL
jgi:hypothetical protein